MVLRDAYANNKIRFILYVSTLTASQKQTKSSKLKRIKISISFFYHNFMNVRILKTLTDYTRKVNYSTER